MPRIIKCAKCGASYNSESPTIGDHFICPSCGENSEIRIETISDLSAIRQSTPEVSRLHPVEFPHSSTGTAIGDTRPPLTSEDVSAIFSEMFRLPFTKLQSLFLLGFASAAPTQVFSEISLHKMRAMGPQPDLLALCWQFGTALAGIVVITTILGAFTVGAMSVAIVDYHLKRPVRLGRAFVDSVLRVPAVLGAAVLVLIVTTTLMVTIIGMPVAIWLGLAWCFYTPAAVLLRTGPVRSLAASFGLVKGYWWRVFGTILVLFMTAYLIVLLPTLIGSFLPDLWNLGISIVCMTFLTTIVEVGMLLTFLHLRVRRQGLTLTQLAQERDALAA